VDTFPVSHALFVPFLFAGAVLTVTILSFFMMARLVRALVEWITSVGGNDGF